MSGTVVYALGVAVSPVPIGAVILVLTCPARLRGGLSFLAGWVAGVAILALLFIALSDADPVWIAALELVLGGAFLLAAAVLWLGPAARGRRRGSTPSTVSPQRGREGFASASESAATSARACSAARA